LICKDWHKRWIEKNFRVWRWSGIHNRSLSRVATVRSERPRSRGSILGKGRNFYSICGIKTGPDTHPVYWHKLALRTTQPHVQTSSDNHIAQRPQWLWDPLSFLSILALRLTHTPVQTDSENHTASCPECLWDSHRLIQTGSKNHTASSPD
jgi:hypothetical protein